MTWKYLHENIENINIKSTCLFFNSFKLCTQLIQEQTNLSSNMGPLWLGFFVVKCTVTAGIEIY